MVLFLRYLCLLFWTIFHHDPAEEDTQKIKKIAVRSATAIVFRYHSGDEEMLGSVNTGSDPSLGRKRQAAH